MKSVRAISRLLVLAVCLTAAPASAASFTVFWDRAAFSSFAAGFGVSPTTAQAAQLAGIPIVQAPGLTPWNPETLVVVNDEVESSLVLPAPLGSAPATIASNWTALNETGLNEGVLNQNLYLVYKRPITNDEQSPAVTYDPADVGLTLSSGTGGLDWVILQVPSNPFDPGSIPVYYPAVSLGILADGATAAYPVFYTLDNPQVFSRATNFELGMPKWSLSFLAVPIPEPSTGLLLFAGLLGIAAGRRSQT